MLGDVPPQASRNIIGNYYRLKNGRYRELRNIYPNIPSHYVHGVCQDAVERISSLRRSENAEIHARLNGGRLAYKDEVEALGFKGFEADVVAEDEVAVVELLGALRSTLTSRVLEDIVVNIKPVSDGVEVALEKGGLLRLDSVIIALGAWSSRILEKLN
jgi:hypothetical protein